MEIPLIIHQIWIGPNKIPEKVIDTIRIDMINKYPECKYILWTEDEIEKNKDKFKLYSLYKLCEMYSGIANLIRLDILYNFGGLYIDADTIYTNNNLNFMDIFNHNKSIITSTIDKTNSYPNGFLGATINNKIIGEMIDNLIYDYNPYIPSCVSTGPEFLTKYIKKNLNEVYVVPEKLIYPNNWHKNGDFMLDKIEKIRISYKDSYFFQIGFTTNKIIFEKDKEKKLSYKCLENSKDPLLPLREIDEYIITIHKKINLTNQMTNIHNLIKIQKVKKPIIYIDERVINNIFNNNKDEINNLLKTADLGLFIHFGAQIYNNIDDIEKNIKALLNNLEIKNLLLYYDPYRSKIVESKINIINMFKKVKIINRNSKKLNSYFER
jgi:hypothetical protein